MLAPLFACVVAAADVPVDVLDPGADDRVAFVGPVVVDDAPGVVLSFSSAGVRLRFAGVARFVFDDTVDASEPGGNRFVAVHDVDEAAVGVDVDGALVVAHATMQTVTVQKTSEALFGARRLVAVVVEGVVDDFCAAAPPRSVLVLGDSWATGFGVRGDLVDRAARGADARGPHCPFTPDTSDVRLAWPARVVRAVDAEAAVVGWSGRGIWRDYTGDRGPLTVPEIFRAAPIVVDGVVGVVVALGHNDGFVGVPDAAAFVDAYRAFVDDVTAFAGGVPVVVVVPAFDDAAPLRSRQEAFAQLLDDPRVVLVDEAVPDARLPLGCVWHPGTAGQRAYADALTLRLLGPLRPR